MFYVDLYVCIVVCVMCMYVKSEGFKGKLFYMVFLVWLHTCIFLSACGVQQMSYCFNE